MTAAPPGPPPIAPPPSSPLPPPRGGRVSVGALFGGMGMAIVGSFLLVLGLLNNFDNAAGAADRWAAGGFAALCLLGGAGLCFVRSPVARGIGIGLMSGWALLSITTAGLCTGLYTFA